eukprot:scaffold3181_cov389-Prasinococcus_capsulatus_cf.AAC.3
MSAALSKCADSRGDGNCNSLLNSAQQRGLVLRRTCLLCVRSRLGVVIAAKDWCQPVACEAPNESGT